MSQIDPLTAQTDIDLMMARRAFAVAQENFAGAVLSTAALVADVGWHGTDLHPEAGSVGLVREDGDYVDLVGEIIKVSRVLTIETRVVYAYVVGTAGIIDDLSLSRRTFLGLGPLSNEQLVCTVEVIA
jgi:hypothetical protein